VYLDSKQGKKSEHFIGTVITKELPTQELGQDVHNLVDGQQRLTTVSILLKSLADSCHGDLPNLRQTIEDLLLFRDAHGKPFLRLEMGRNDRPYFEAIMKEP